MIPDEAVEAAARGMAILDDHDGCFLEVDAWNAQEEWEREAWPDNYPGSAIEDCAYWIAKAKAALEAAAPHMLERHEAAIRAVLAYGADREKYTDAGDPKVDAAIKSYAYHVRRVMSDAYGAAK